MFVIKTYIQSSSIQGLGVFAAEDIPKGKIVWLYDPKCDLSVTPEEYAQFNEKQKAHFAHSAYLSPWTGLWICPPYGDNSNYTNHSNDNNLSVHYDGGVSSEPFFVANRNIAAGEEITNNYHEFDELTRRELPEWSL